MQYILIDDPKEQKILIESDKTSFNDSLVVAKILQKAFANLLELDGSKEDKRQQVKDIFMFWINGKGYVPNFKINTIYPCKVWTEKVNVVFIFVDEVINKPVKSLRKRIINFNFSGIFFHNLFIIWFHKESPKENNFEMT